jgi:hypothetical protein
MDAIERVNWVRYLRANLSVKHRLRLELQAAISRLLREHEIEIHDDVLRYLTIADEEEFGMIGGGGQVLTPSPVMAQAQVLTPAPVQSPPTTPGTQS